MTLTDAASDLHKPFGMLSAFLEPLEKSRQELAGTFHRDVEKEEPREEIVAHSPWRIATPVWFAHKC